MKLFRSRLGKILASFLVVNILAQIGSPVVAWAITGGPSNQNAQGSPVGASEMVDLFSGDFSYNIPLLELPGPDGGYPFSLNYNSNVGMEQEASWVGLGWSLTPGAINRNLSGYPDEFDGDQVKIEQDIRPNSTYGVSVRPGLEAMGWDKANISLGGFSLYYNTFKGMGYSVSTDISIALYTPDNAATADTTSSLGLNIGLDFDSQNGASASPSISVSSEKKTTGLESTYSIGGKFNSISGLENLSLGANYNNQNFYNIRDGSMSYNRGSVNSSISLSKPNYTLSVGMPMLSEHLNISLKLGGSIYAFFNNMGISGFMNEQHLKKEYRNYNLEVFGYNNMHNVSDDNKDEKNQAYDYSKSGQGILSPKMKNLPVPSANFDEFSVSGAGMSGVFRAFRNDIGALHETKIRSNGVNANAAFDVGMNKLGWSPGGGYNQSTQQGWQSIVGTFKDFEYSADKPSSNDNYQSYYYKMKGEPTIIDRNNDLKYMNYEDPMMIQLRDLGGDNPFLDTKVGRINGDTFSKKLERGTFLDKRRTLNTVISALTITQLINLTKNNQNNEYPPFADNNNYPKKHPGAYSILGNNGVRYIYGHPDFNMSKVEHVFSTTKSFRDMEGLGTGSDFNTGLSMNATIDLVNGDVDYKKDRTDKFFNKKTTPAYANSHMLSTMLGSDYVDVKQDGPTDDDLGYWVKFEYDKKNSAENGSLYKWRAPFSKAALNEGNDKASVSDNTASYVYGEKEMSYLKTATTKTHIAVFHTSERRDAYGANNELQNNNDLGAKSYKLDSINLYTKSEYLANGENAVPLKTVHFKYNYDLCRGMSNAESEMQGGKNVQIGKLTLEKVYFTYRNNNRGALTPYEFKYNVADKVENPNYNEYMMDRWGNYAYRKGLNAFYTNGTDNASEVYNNKLWNFKFPYSKQIEANMNYLPENTTNGIYPQSYTQGNRDDQKKEIDQNAAVWCLKEITLPTGAKIKVNYEADDYAYVQDKQAMQMFKILGFSDSNVDNSVSKIKRFIAKSDLENKGVDEGIQKIYFRPVEAISESDLDQAKKDYFDQVKSLYFNVDVYLDRGSANGEDRSIEKDDEKINGLLSHNITGWADVSDNDSYGFIKSSGSSNYDIGWVKIKMVSAKTKDKAKPKYHPISVAAWQYMHYYMPRFENNSGDSEVSSNSTKDEKIARVKALASGFTSAVKSLKGYYQYAYDKEMASTFRLNKSFIRLNNPDFKKYGGGNRVKEIILYDAWNAKNGNLPTDEKEEQSIYGQVYDYTTQKKGRSKPISSGVATYEPLAGGDENALRQVKKYTTKDRMMIARVIDFVFPINEHMYPGPMVGYSKVTVKSLATHYSKIPETVPGNDPYNIPDGIMTTGKMVNEFYTAKDFPVISRETPIEINTPKFKQNRIVYSLNKSGFYASQGYQTILNDMHGKPKKITYIEQNKDGSFKETGNPYVEYIYREKDFTYTDALGVERTVRVLDNNVKVLESKIDIPEIAPSDGLYNAKTVDKLMSVDWDVSLETNQNVTFDINASVDFNLDGLTLPFPPFYFPLPSVVPHLHYSESRVKSAVLSKVFYYHGIINKVISYDGQATVASKDLVYSQNGTPVLTSVTNQFDQQLYQYNTPAYYDYSNSGMAYKNIGYTFNANLEKISTSSFPVLDNGSIDRGNTATNYIAKETNYKAIADKTILDKLVPGDELIFDTDYGTSRCTYVSRLADTEALFTHFAPKKRNGANPVVFIDGALPSNGSNSFTVIRSGKRNFLSASSNTLVTKENPLFGYLKSSSSQAVEDYFYRETDLNIRLHGITYNQAILKDYVDQLNAALAELKNASTTTISYPLVNTLIYGRPGNGSGNIIRSLLVSFFSNNNLSVTTIDGNSNSSFITIALPGVNSLNDLNFSLSNDFANELPTIQHYFDYFVIQLKKNNVVLGTDIIYYKDVATIGSRIETFFQSATPKPQNSDFFSLNKVLAVSTSAVSDATPGLSPIDALNPFRNGLLGTFRANESYAYVQDREQSKLGTTSSIDLKNSGHMDNVALFDVKNPFFSQQQPKWVKASQVTRYNADGYQLETKDALGVYSSALYNDATELMTAMATNAKYDEIGFEDFEGGIGNNGNINFKLETVNSSTKYIKQNVFKVISGRDKVAIVDLPYDPNFGTKQINLSVAKVKDFTNKSISGNYTATMQPYYETETTPYTNKSVLVFKGDNAAALSGQDFWIGDASITSFVSREDISLSSSDADFTDKYKHSGKKSLWLKSRTIGSNEPKTIKELNDMNFIAGKSYNLDAWTSLGAQSGEYASFGFGATKITQAPTANPKYAISYPPCMSVGFKAKGSSTISWQSPFFPNGQVINGWQKTGGAFVVPVNTEKVFIRFDQAQFNVNGGATSAGKYDTYFDDLRISPSDAEMTCSVYDKALYRLMAQLDARNFATYYYYDDQGNMYLTKVETESGVRTISDSRTHLSEQR